jgi:uncharacterized protein YkvS
MRGNKKESIPQSKKYIVIPKKQFKKFLKIQIAHAKDVIEIKKGRRAIIEKEVRKYVDGYMSEIRHIKKEYSIWRKILIEKGVLTRNEINEELRK